MTVTPKEYVAESVVASLHKRVKGKRVLLVRAKVARDVIPRELRKAGATVDVIEAYETVVPKSSERRLRALLAGKRKPHAITFTSSSTVKNFVALAGLARRAGGAEEARATSRSPQRIDWSRDFGNAARVRIAGRYRSEEIRHSWTGRCDCCVPETISMQSCEKMGRLLLIDRTPAARRRHAHLQKIGDALVGVDLVFDARELVAFVLVNLQLHEAAVFLDGRRDLLGFGCAGRARRCRRPATTAAP